MHLDANWPPGSVDLMTNRLVPLDSETKEDLARDNSDQMHDDGRVSHRRVHTPMIDLNRLGLLDRSLQTSEFEDNASDDASEHVKLMRSTHRALLAKLDTFGANHSEEDARRDPDACAGLAKLLENCPCVLPQAPGDDLVDRVIPDAERLRDAVQRLRAGEYDLPLVSHQQESAILREAVHGEPMCSMGKQCQGIVGGIRLPANSGPDTGWVLLPAMSAAQFNAWVTDPTKVPPQGKCVLCRRRATCTLLLQLFAMGDSVAVRLDSCFQTHRILVDHPTGYRSDAVLLPQVTTWRGVFGPVVRFEPGRLQWTFDRKCNRWFVDQSDLVYVVDQPSAPLPEPDDAVNMADSLPEDQSLFQ